MTGDVTTDTLLEGRLTIAQFARGHRVGTDALLLASATTLDGGLAVDLGAGVGAVGLAFALLNPNARILLVEREPALVDLARENIAANGLEHRVTALALDVFAPESVRVARGLGRQVARLVLTNPPYFETGVRASPDGLKSAAHVMAGGDLPGWIRTAASCLAPDGRIALVHRADRLSHALAALEPAFGETTLRFIHPSRGAPAIRLLATATRGSRAPLRVDAPKFLAGPSAPVSELSAVQA